MNRTRRLTALAATASVGAARWRSRQAPCPFRRNQRPVRTILASHEGSMGLIAGRLARR